MSNIAGDDDQQLSSLLDLVVRIDDLPHEVRKFPFDADAETLKYLAEKAGVLSIARFEGFVDIRAMRGGFEAKGSLRVQLTQECVSTLEPVDDELNVEIKRIYLRGEEPELDVTSNGEVYIDLESSADNEWFQGDILDLSEFVYEQFALSINQYPRKAGAPQSVELIEDDSKEKSPFAALSALKETK